MTTYNQIFHTFAHLFENSYTHPHSHPHSITPTPTLISVCTLSLTLYISNTWSIVALGDDRSWARYIQRNSWKGVWPHWDGAWEEMWSFCGCELLQNRLQGKLIGVACQTCQVYFPRDISSFLNNILNFFSYQTCQTAHMREVREAVYNETFTFQLFDGKIPVTSKGALSLLKNYFSFLTLFTPSFLSRYLLWHTHIRTGKTETIHIGVWHWERGVQHTGEKRDFIGGVSIGVCVSVSECVCVFAALAIWLFSNISLNTLPSLKNSHFLPSRPWNGHQREGGRGRRVVSYQTIWEWEGSPRLPMGQ